MSDTDPQPECPDVAPPVSKQCCKCDAYREIIAEQATKLAQAKVSINEIRQWSRTLDRFCSEAEGKK